MAKPKIDAKSVLDDIRSGLDDAALMQKYNLSAKGLQSLFGKLVKAGLLHESYGSDKDGQGLIAPSAPREVSAKDVISDIRSGMSDRGLMKKYRLSGKGVQNLFEQLLQAGLIKEADLDENKLSRETTVELAEEELGATLLVTGIQADAESEEVEPENPPWGEPVGRVLRDDADAALLITDDIRAEDLAVAEADFDTLPEVRPAPPAVQEVRIDAPLEEPVEETVSVITDTEEGGGPSETRAPDEPVSEPAPALSVQEIRITEEPEPPAPRTTALISGDVVAKALAKEQAAEAQHSETEALEPAPDPEPAAAPFPIEPLIETSVRGAEPSLPMSGAKADPDESTGQDVTEIPAVSPREMDRPPWHCPACGQPQSRVFQTCPACGISVAKYGEVKRRQSEQAERASAGGPAMPPVSMRAPESFSPLARRSAVADRQQSAEPATAFGDEYRPDFNPESLAGAMRIFAVLLLALALGFAGAGAYLLSLAVFQPFVTADPGYLLLVAIFLASALLLVFSVAVYMLLRGMAMTLRMLAVISTSTARIRVQLTKVLQRTDLDKT
ncbi:MAG: hypothetical protein HY914_06710 [Desulfomonile tiedjei]|nr:hypothetical protein [Desulfomonile tiedjei]